MITKCDFVSHIGFGGSKADCLQCTPDLSQPISKPGVIRAEAMADARKLRWFRADPPVAVELHETYIGARYDEHERVWMLGRVRWCEHCGQFEVAQDKRLVERAHEKAHITHFCADIIGTP